MRRRLAGGLGELAIEAAFRLSGAAREAGPERVKRIRDRLSGMLESRQKANAEAAARLA